MTLEQKRELVRSYPYWWHTMHLGEGIVTHGRQGGGCASDKLAGVSDDLFAGKRVLDVGTWDGKYAFAAEQRGASEVVAVDRPWSDALVSPSWVPSQRGFEIAQKLLESNVQYRVGYVGDVTEAEYGTFDTILLFGVLYHLQDPLRALRALFGVLRVGGSLLIETTVTHHMPEMPIMLFHPGVTCGNDPTNYWSPTELCMCRIIEEFGVKVAGIIRRCPPDPVTLQGRTHFHARKER